MKEKQCHKGMRYVFSIGKTEVFAGGSKRGGFPMGLLINLAENTHRLRLEGEVKGKMKLKKYTGPMVHIEWPDFGIPSFKKDFWLDLIEVIKANPPNASIMCVGGHGRTGTALAILGSLSGAINGDPVAEIRRIYCEEVVETISQIKYIEKMTGVATKEKERYEPSYTLKGIFK